MGLDRLHVVSGKWQGTIANIELTAPFCQLRPIWIHLNSHVTSSVWPPPWGRSVMHTLGSHPQVETRRTGDLGKDPYITHDKVKFCTLIKPRGLYFWPCKAPECRLKQQGYEGANRAFTISRKNHLWLFSSPFSKNERLLTGNCKCPAFEETGSQPSYDIGDSIPPTPCLIRLPDHTRWWENSLRSIHLCIFYPCAWPATG